MTKELTYKKIAQKYISLIENGHFSGGEKMPSIRQLMGKEKISLATANHAYEVLMDKGFIEVKPQSGYYVTYKSPEVIDECCKYTVKKEAIKIKVSEIVYRMISASTQKNMINFGAGVVDAEFLPNKEINLSINKLIKEDRNHSSNYLFPPGHLGYRRQILKRLEKIKIKANIDNVIATQGCMEAILLSLKVITKPGDTILIETPSYYGTLQALESLDLKVVEVPNHPQKGIDPNYISDTISKHRNIKAALLISNFSNPIGNKIPDSNKKIIAEIFQKAQIPVIEDDIYGELSFEKTRPTTLKSYTPENVFYCSSLSKTISPGLRAGFVVAPAKYKEDVERLQFISSVANASLSQFIAEKILEAKFYEAHCQNLATNLKNNILKFQQSIQKYFPQGTKVTNPEGGFFLWIELPEGIDSVDLYNEVIKKNIIIAPGVIFSPSGDYKNYIRLATGGKWSDKTERAIKTIGEMAQALL